VAQAVGQEEGCAQAATQPATPERYGYALDWRGVAREVVLGCGASRYAPLYVTFDSRRTMLAAVKMALSTGGDPVCHTATELFTVDFDFGNLAARRFCAAVGASAPANPVHLNLLPMQARERYGAHALGVSPQTVSLLVGLAALAYLAVIAAGRLAGRQVRTRLRCLLGLLAVAAIAFGIHEQPKRGVFHSPWRSVTAADATLVARTFATLHTPVGFTRGGRCQFTPPGAQVCFVRDPSIVLYTANWARLIANTGAQPIPLFGPAFCGVNRTRLGLRVQGCNNPAVQGRLLVSFFANSVVNVGATSVVGTTKPDHAFAAGTHIAVEALEVWKYPS